MRARQRWGDGARGAIACAALVLVACGRREARELPAPASPTTLHELGDIAPGMKLGAFVVQGVLGPFHGAVLVRAASPAEAVTYEVRVLSDRPLPASRTDRYAVYYQGTDGSADVLEGAGALAEAIEKAPKDAATPAGLTKYPTVLTAL